MKITGIEREILVELCRGKTRNEIAAHRQRSLKTIETQIANARKRNGAATIAHLLYMAGREGLGEAPSTWEHAELSGPRSALNEEIENLRTQTAQLLSQA